MVFYDPVGTKRSLEQEESGPRLKTQLMSKSRRSTRMRLTGKVGSARVREAGGGGCTWCSTAGWARALALADS
jgi:hypothetical protein